MAKTAIGLFENSGLVDAVVRSVQSGRFRSPARRSLVRLVNSEHSQICSSCI